MQQIRAEHTSVMEVRGVELHRIVSSNSARWGIGYVVRLARIALFFEYDP